MGQIDLYCERLSPSFWAEPINALSNGAFIIAAIYGFSLAHKRGGMDIWETLVLFLALLIGPGSFLFHTFANSQSELADVTPIWTFVAAYVALTIYRATGHNRLKTLRILTIVAIITTISTRASMGDLTTNTDLSIPQSVGVLNGSLQYLPALVALVAFTIIAQIRHHPARKLILSATVIFTLSLCARSLDLRVCAGFPIGSHFLWHLLNALMIGILLRVLVIYAPPVTTKNTHNTKAKEFTP